MMWALNIYIDLNLTKLIMLMLTSFWHPYFGSMSPPISKCWKYLSSFNTLSNSNYRKISIVTCIIFWPKLTIVFLNISFVWLFLTKIVAVDYWTMLDSNLFVLDKISLSLSSLTYESTLCSLLKKERKFWIYEIVQCFESRQSQLNSFVPLVLIA